MSICAKCGCAPRATCDCPTAALRARLAEAEDALRRKSIGSDDKLAALGERTTERDEARAALSEARGLLREVHRIDRKHSTLTFLPRELSDRIDSFLGGKEPPRE